MRIQSILSLALIGLGAANVHADYEAAVMADNPFAYFRFEEDEGADELLDSTENGYVGSEVNNVEFGQTGVVGRAGEFFGDSSIVTDLEFDPSIEGLSNWTIETWFYSTATTEIDDPDNPGETIEVVAAEQVYISQKDGTGLGRSNMLITSNRQPGSFIGGATSNAIDPFDGENLLPESWYHFVMAHNGEDEELTFWVNGEPSELNPVFPGANGVESADGPWVIGSHKNQGIQFFTGLLDEIAFYDYVLNDEQVETHYDAAMGDTGLAGDFDGDGELTAADIDRLTTAVRDGLTDSLFDLDASGVVDADDRLFWVRELKNTYVGDSNLDGVFNSSDLVNVFAKGEYEDSDLGNSTWASGDWDGNGDFSSADFVAAFSDGGYEQPPKAATLAAVPEPASNGLVLLGMWMVGRWRRCRRSV